MINSKIFIGLISVAIVLAIGWYFLSPFSALNTVSSAVRASDRDELAISVDFPSVRESLKSQFNAFLVKSAQSDPSLKDNPFAGLAIMIVPIMVDHIVDGYVTPDGIAILLKPQMRGREGEGFASVLRRGQFSYLDMDHFRVSLFNENSPDQPLSMIFERRGIFSWKLVRLDLPLDAIAEAAAAAKRNNAREESPTSPDGAASSTEPTEPDTQPAEPDAQPNVENSTPDEPLPTVVGQCAQTKVTSVGTRLQNEDGSSVPGSGSVINYSDGGYQVSYDQVSGIDNSNAGDEVQLCLVSVPDHCPPGDDRGRVYHAKNLRTRDEWEEADSEHSCGGA